MKFEDIYPEEDNTAGGIFAGSTSSRARLFSQQRSLMSKKRQNQLQNEGNNQPQSYDLSSIDL